jgi:hypothetical protein
MDPKGCSRDSGNPFLLISVEFDEYFEVGITSRPMEAGSQRNVTSEISLR